MFVTVEGLDGSGTTTLSNSLSDALDETTLTREPSESWYGYDVRDRMSDEDTDPLIDTLLFFVDRVGHIDRVIQPELGSGQTVICDRYADSTRAYQPVTLVEEHPLFHSQAQAMTFVESTMAQWILEPDLTFYLDLDAETALARADREQKYEKERTLSKVRENYQTLSQARERIHTIDATQTKENVLREALSVVRAES